MKRRLIIFRLIGNNTVGLGHVYRALSIANEFDKKKYQFKFITDKRNELAKKIIHAQNQICEVFEKQLIIKKIIQNKPILVINDILNTNISDVKNLKKNFIKVINFEDLGKGANFADLVINELYERPIIKGKNIKWGSKYFFIRDEFLKFKPKKFPKTIKNIIITFGGTDSKSITRKILEKIYDFCLRKDISIYIITGPGYLKYLDLKKLVNKKLKKNVFLTHSTGVISNYMMKSDLAICSNGRTVYELTHLNIPSIVVSQHDRELTHNFSTEKNGIISVGKYKKRITESFVFNNLSLMIEDHKYRRQLFNRLNNFNFDNKDKVMKLIYSIIDDK